MKFLKEDGTIEEGVQITDEQIAELERLEQVLHASMCGGNYHPSYDRSLRKCRKLAVKVICGNSLESVLADEFLPKPSPEEEHPSSFPTGVEA
jgi:hypothetical protein